MTGDAGAIVLQGGANPAPIAKTETLDRVEQRPVDVLPPQCPRRRPHRLTGGVLLLTVGAIGSLAATTYLASWQRRAEHTAPVHRDTTVVVTTGAERASPAWDAELVLKLADGGVRRVAARRGEAAVFVDETLAFLDAERAAIVASIESDIAALIERAFADREQAIQRYADWHFAWGQSWRLTGQAIGAAIEQIPKSAFSAESMSEAVRHHLEAYLLRHYRELVLKPAVRDPMIARGVEEILKQAHRRYLRAVATVDRRLQRFLAEKTGHLDATRAATVTAVRLDWDAARWAAPRHAVEDQATRTLLRGTQALTVTALLAQTVGPAIERELLVVFGAASARLAAALMPGLLKARPSGGAAGRWQGWLIAAGMAVGIDWLTSRAQDHWQRPDFVKANREAVETTMATWRAVLTKHLVQAADIWLDDTRGVVAAESLARVPTKP